MASNTSSQFFPNDLQPIPVDEPTLSRVLAQLRAAVSRGIELIQSKHPAPNAAEAEDASGTIFSGSLGIALMFLRLEQQAHALSHFNHVNGEYDPPLPDFRSLMRQNVNPYPLELSLQPGRPSPLCSPSLGASIIRILARTRESESAFPSQTVKADSAALHEAVQTAIHQDPVVIRHGHAMGGDEVLYGRAGLLWALASIDSHSTHSDNVQALGRVEELQLKVKDAIMEAGKRGSEEFARVYGETEAVPLMWPWLDDYYGLGAMHGITGILTVLLDSPLSEEECFTIGHTITSICKICISHNGHLPMSMPPWPSSRLSPLVQICHGTPGLLLLLAAAKKSPGLIKYHVSEWDEALRLGSERVWEDGLLSKGGGLCHGIAGNAWPWLLLHETYIADEQHKATPLDAEKTTASPHEKLSADYFLSRALAFLLAAQETQPFATASRYRMPDNPFSLFEGLAGTICAWSEACAVITARLQLMEAQPEDHSQKRQSRDGNPLSQGSNVLGFPGLGGMGSGT